MWGKYPKNVREKVFSMFKHPLKFFKKLILECDGRKIK